MEIPKIPSFTHLLDEGRYAYLIPAFHITGILNKLKSAVNSIPVEVNSFFCSLWPLIR